MRNLSLLIFALLLTATSLVYSQSSKSTRINLYGAYAFEDSFDSYYDLGNYYQGQLQDGIMYGVGIEYEIRPNAFLELSYLREDTNAPTQYYNGGLFDKYTDFDVSLNYVMLGVNHSFRKQGSKIEGFGGLMAGMAIVGIDNPDTNKSNTATKFAWGLKGGAIIWATNKVGVKLQGQLLSIAQSVGGGFYYGPGGGGTSVSSYSSLYQFTIGGGLVFEIGK